MDNIVIKQIKNEIGNYLVFSTSVESPFFALEKINNMIKDKKAIIIFDQLLQIGDSDDRFISFEFNGEINLYTAKVIKEKNTDALKKETSEYLKTHPELIKYSILLSSQKNEILSGGVV